MPNSPTKNKAPPRKKRQAGNLSKSEPRRLRRGKAFHQAIQQEWSTVAGARPEVTIRDLRDKSGRIDILVDEGEDWVSVVEIKRTDWDRMKPYRVRPNALRHARQVWRYVEPFLDRLGRDVCPGIIYEHIPKTRGRVEVVEEALHERGIQVVWHTESFEDLRARAETSSEEASSFAR